jgi:hypothetical protein
MTLSTTDRVRFGRKVEVHHRLADDRVHIVFWLIFGDVIPDKPKPKSRTGRSRPLDW